MLSKSAHLKSQAIKLRKSGKSIREVEEILSIPRSTLSGWFKDVKISKKHEVKLHERWVKALDKARHFSAIAHNNQKRARIELANKNASDVLSQIDTSDKNIIDLALAMLYWGEGFKSGTRLALGNSDSTLLSFFISALKKNYSIEDGQIRCDLHLRADQDIDKLKRYWSKELPLPLSCFKGVQVDKRTVGKVTYDSYKGVCVLTIGNVAIQRKLMYLSRIFSEKLAVQKDKGPVAHLARALA